MLKRLLIFFISVLTTTLSISQTLTTTRISVDDAANPLIGGALGRVILGISVDKTAGAVNFTNLVVSTGATNPNAVFSSIELWTSATNFAGAVNTNATVILNTSDITFTGNPTNLFSYGAGVITGRTFYIVATIRPDVASTSGGVPSIVLSVTDANTTYSGSPTETAFNLTGTTFDFQGLVADLNQNADNGASFAGDLGVELLDFTLLSNGTQSINSPLIFTFDVDVTNILQNFDLQVGGADIPGGETYTLNGAGTQLTVAAFTNVDISTIKNFQLFADVRNSVVSTNDFIISLAPTGVVVSQGGVEAFATLTNEVDITGLEADFTQNIDDDNAIGGQVGVELLDFSVISNGTQSINSPLIFTFDSDVTNILQNFDLRVDGLDIPGGESYTLNGAGTQLTIAAYTNVNITASRNFQLLADIRNTVVSSDDFSITLTPSGVAVSAGVPEAFTPITNSIDVTALTADFTQNTDDGIVTVGQSGVELLDFSVISNTTGITQFVNTPLIFTFDRNITSILTGFDLRVDGLDIPGGESYTLNGAGTQLTIAAFTNVDITTSRNFQLLANIAAGATVTDDFTITLTNSNVNVNIGYVESYGSFSNSIDITTSQLSDVIFTGSSSLAVTYRTHQSASIDNTNLSLSHRLGTFQLRDGGGAADADNKETSITSITIQVSNPANIRRIALFDDESSQDEIPGTEQPMPGSGTVVFTPSMPIRTDNDGGDFDFMVRVTFNNVVVDNQPMHITITNVVSENNFSGFATTNAGGATSSGGTNNTIIVNISRFLDRVTANPNPSPVSTNFGLTVEAVDGNPFNNRDLDYAGSVDITASGGAGTLLNGGQRTLTMGQVLITNLQLNQAGTYSIDISDDAYTDAPENQTDFGDDSSPIVVNSSNSIINQPPALNLCFGGSFQTLGNIVIAETDAAGFSSNGSFSIGLPTGFIFDTGTNPTLTMSNSTTTFSAISYTGENIVQFTYNITAPTGNNSLTIAGLRIRYPGSTSPPGGNMITRSGGTASLAGVGGGTQLATVNAILGTDIPPGILDYTVQALVGDVSIEPDETNFSNTSNAIQLVGSPSGGVFTGSGVTLVSSQYRFNPSSLATGTYPIIYTYTAGSQQCQFTVSKNLVVYSSGINGLAPLYCNNDMPVSLSVDQATLDLIGPNLSVDHFSYYDFSIGYQSINLPANTIFNPALTAYQRIYNQSSPILGIYIAFFVCDNDAITTVPPCNGASTRFGRVQFVEVRPAPSPSFSIASAFCEDNVPVTLIGNPPNSNNTADDRFDANGTAVSAITQNVVAGKVVWTFSPSAVTGVTSSTPQTFDITYKYTDPVTQCDNISTRSVTVKDRPLSVPDGSISKSPTGPIPNTTLQLCQNEPVGSFTATAVSGTTYSWYNDATLTQLSSTLNSFTPSVDNTVAGLNDFFVTRTTGAELFPFFFPGCESDKGSVVTPLELTVNVVASPPAPTPNFTDAIRQYCVNDVTLDPTHLGVPGTNLRWHTSLPVGLGSQITSIVNDNQPTQNELGITFATAKNFRYFITQTETVNQCQSLPTELNVRIQALPVVTIDPIRDPLLICTTDDNILFQGFDAGVAAPGTDWFVVGSPSPGPGALTNFNSVAGTVELNPSTGIPGNYQVRYTYSNSAGCSNFATRNITILPSITPIIPFVNVCDGLPAEFVNGSTINPPSSSSTIANIGWVFGDGSSIEPGAASTIIPAGLDGGKTGGTYFQPTHRYPNVGTFQASGVLVTSDGCKYPFPPSSSTLPITVSPQPIADFNWGRICRDTLSGQTSTQFQALEKSTPPIAISSAIWNFKVNNTLGFNSAGVGLNPVVNYHRDGKDLVELLIISAQGCRDSIQKPVFVVPNYDSIVPLRSYIQNFDIQSGGWIAGGVNTSWVLGNPSGSVFTGDSSPLGTGNAWDTNLNGDSNPNENSFVASPCFNFTKATRPIISLDIWSDTPEQVDGAVLQYFENGKIEDDASWNVVGAINAGINWYDDSGIVNSPGNQTSGDVGWTGNAVTSNGKYSNWSKAIFQLDNLIGKNNIIFRVAFASGPGRSDGFAFDNVFVGERTRTVLLENFTNSSSAANSTASNNVFNTFGTAAELVKVQYHTPFPGKDPLNSLNTAMNNSRTAFYGITEAPTMRVDGTNAPTLGVLNSIFDTRVLTPTPIIIEAVATKVGNVVRISTSLINRNSIPAQIADSHLFTTLVEKVVDEPVFLGSSGNAQFTFVAKQMLPSPAGIRIGQNIPANDTLVLADIIWDDPKLIDPIDNAGIVIALQSITGGNKDVLQAYYLDNPPQPDLVTEIEEGEKNSFISIYPNPANDNVEIKLQEVVRETTALTLTDQFGRNIDMGTLEKGSKEKTISVKDLADGLYILSLQNTQITHRRKVMVVHR